MLYSAVAIPSSDNLISETFALGDQGCEVQDSQNKTLKKIASSKVYLCRLVGVQVNCGSELFFQNKTITVQTEHFFKAEGNKAYFVDKTSREIFVLEPSANVYARILEAKVDGIKDSAKTVCFGRYIPEADVLKVVKKK
jgi:hypothetical protein